MMIEIFYRIKKILVMIKMITVMLMINDYYDDSDIKDYNGNDNAYNDNKCNHDNDLAGQSEDRHQKLTGTMMEILS